MAGFKERSFDSAVANCVSKETFESQIKGLKDSQKTNKSSVNVFVNEDFYYRVKNYLKVVAEQDLGLAPSIANPELSKSEINTINRKKWKYSNGKLLTAEGKEVAHQGMLYDILSRCHQRIAHRGRQKTEKWIAENYSEVTQKVVNTFVSLCRFHAEQKPITTRMKPVVSPLQSQSFLSLIEVDLMDFRNCPCECDPKHKWAINIIDHHTKFVNVHPIHNKSAEDVLSEVQKYCLIYGYPKKMLTDNGGEFENKKMKTFCSNNEIQLLHGAARTPTTQGLVERSNRTFKEDMRALIMSTCGLEIAKWCKYTMQASYIMNITYHRAINMTPYEAVFHMKAKRELLDHAPEEEHGLKKDPTPREQQTPEEDHVISTTETRSQASKKRKAIEETQKSYNAKMIKQSEANPRKRLYKVGEMVSIKIDRVDKKSPMHPNLLLGKVIEVQNNYVQVVTPFGRIKGLIAPSRLFPCTATNVKLDYEKEISFTGACKLAENAQ